MQRGELVAQPHGDRRRLHRLDAHIGLLYGARSSELRRGELAVVAALGLGRGRSERFSAAATERVGEAGGSFSSAIGFYLWPSLLVAAAL